MASKADIEKMARAIGRARKRLPVGAVSADGAAKKLPGGGFARVPPAWGDTDLFIEYICEEIAAEFPEPVARLERGGYGGVEQIETLIDVERMQ